MITIKNLLFNYSNREKPVINDLSFEIHPGKVYVLLGLNGCGKTTLIKLLAGLYKPTSGIIEYNNQDLQSIKINERSKLFSYVSQKGINNDDYNVKDYLTYGYANSLKFYESPKQEQVSQVNEIAKKFHIENLLNKKIGQLSGGEKQIVMIASSIIQNTEIILLDEPTSALDLKNQNLVLSALKDISSNGKTIIFSSHNPNHALFLDADVLLMNDGKITKSGSSNEIIDIESLNEIYGKNLCYSKDLGYNEISFIRSK